MARFRTLILASAIFLTLAGPSRSQQPDTTVNIVPRLRPEQALTDVPGANLRVDTALVLVPVRATNAAGASMTSLASNDFHVFEDGVEQKIATFSDEDAPLSVGLVFDASGSMSNKIRTSARAAKALFTTANAQDEFFLVEFGGRPKLALPFTFDFDLLVQKISRVRPFGRTSLIDAIHLALLQMKNARNSRKAVVVLSDGGDNCSRLTRRELKSALLESDVQLFAMGIFDQGSSKQPKEEANGPQLLNELAEATGGRSYPVEHLDDLVPISAAIGRVLRNQYLLGYAPTNQTRDGKYRHISVKLTEALQGSAATVAYRHGYYAPQ